MCQILRHESTHVEGCAKKNSNEFTVTRRIDEFEDVVVRAIEYDIV